MKLPYVFAENINGTTEKGIVKIEGSGIKLICICTKGQSKTIIDAFAKSIKWNELDEEISKYYAEEDLPDDSEDDNDGLFSIGELAATAFGYL